MTRLAATLALACCLFACKSSGDPSKAVKQYRAWCFRESKPLGPWYLDRAKAQAEIDAHRKIWPSHNASVKVWTGDPAITGAK